jgi:hypothetical protein
MVTDAPLAKAVTLHATKTFGEERRYSSCSFSTSALNGGEWSVSRPGSALAPGKAPPVSIVQEAGWAPEPVWTERLEEKSSCLCWRSNLDRPVVQSVARPYTDWATRLTTWAPLPNYKIIQLDPLYQTDYPVYRSSFNIVFPRIK